MGLPLPLPWAISLNDYFLTPSVWYGLLALPLLLLMYFLRLRRQEKILSSTLLWGEAIKDLRVNAPFQRIRASLLLILQVLLLLLLAFSLMRPFWEFDSSNARLLVILIDNSASMNTTDGQHNNAPMTRLEQARAVALDSTRHLNANDQIMVAEFSQRPRTMQSFTNVRASVERAIRDIKPTDQATDFREAMKEIQAAILTKRATLADPNAVRPKIVLYSDGAFDRRDLDLDPALFDGFEYIKCGQERSDNVGLTALNVRRSLTRGVKDPLQAFFTVENFSFEPKTVKIRVSLGENVVPITKTVTLTPRPDPNVVAPPDLQQSHPWRQDIMLPLDPGSSGPLTVSLQPPEGTGSVDSLPTDDVAVVNIPKPENTKIMVVMRENANIFVRRALVSLQQTTGTKGTEMLIDYQTPEQFEGRYGKGIGEGEIAQVSDYDVVIFNDYAPKFRAGCSALFFGAIPALPGYKGKEPVEAPTVIDTNRSHYVTRYLNLNYINVAKATVFEFPRSAEVLLRMNYGALITADDDGRYRTIVVAMDLWEGNWLLHWTFPLFMTNAVDYLTGASERSGGQTLRTGDALAFPPVNVEESIELIDPAGGKHPLTLSVANPVYYAGTAHCGLYKYQGADGDWRYYGVNLANAQESDNAMEPTIKPQGGAPIIGQDKGKENREIWPYLVMIGLVILMIEWLVYHRQWSN